MSEIVAIIPARGGSKGLPGKNILDLHGYPLIAWSIKFALSRDEISKVIVSTDDSKIAEVAVFYGAEVPFLRSPELAADDSSTADVVLDIIKRCQLSYSDVLLLLEPTSPYRVLSDFEQLLQLLNKHKAKKVMSVTEAVSASHMFQYFRSDETRGMLTPVSSGSNFSSSRRQDIPKSYFLDGTFYASVVEDFVRNPTFLDLTTHSFVSDSKSSFEVDSFFDLELYRSIFQYFGPPVWSR